MHYTETFFVILEEVAKDNANVKLARNFDIFIVAPKFIEDVKNGAAPSVAVRDNLICTWGGDVSFCVLTFNATSHFELFHIPTKFSVCIKVNSVMLNITWSY